MKSNSGYTIGPYSSSSFLTYIAKGYYDVRPVINLKADVKISGGIGTINDPYVVE